MADNFNEQELRSLLDGLNKLKETTTPATEAMAKLEERAKEVRDAWGKYLKKDLVDTADTFGKSMVSATDSMGKYNVSIDLLTGSTKNLLSTYGVLGKGVGKVIEIFSRLTKGSLEQYDALEKTYRNLSQFGVYGESFDKIKDQMVNAGLDVNTQGELFAKVLRENSQGFQMLGGSVSTGSDRFNKIAGELKSSEHVLSRFGIGLEEAYERTGKVIGSLSISNQTRSKSDKELANMSVQYLANLTALNDITGKTRDQQEQEQQARMNDARLQLKLSEMSAEDQLKFNTVLSSMPTHLQKGFVSMFVNGGKIVDEEATKFYQQQGMAGFNGLMDVMKKPLDKVPDAYLGWMQGAGERTKDFSTKFRDSIMTSNDAMEQFGYTADTVRFQQQALSLTEEKREEMRKKMADALTKTNKADTDAGVDRRKTERAMRGVMEELYMQISKFVIPAMTNLMKGFMSFGKTIADMIVKFGGPDLRGLFLNFENMDEVTKAVTEEQKIQQKLQEELNKLTNRTNEEKEEEIRMYQLKAIRDAGGGLTGMEEQDLRVLEEKDKKRDVRMAEIKQQMSTSKSAEGMARSWGSSIGGSKTGKDALEGLKIKEGDVQADDAGVDPNLLILARQVQAQIPGFKHFTGFNDKFHQEKSPSSLHTAGKAFDFVLEKPPTKEEGAAIVKMLKDMGAAHAIDEYANPSKKATGGHIHAQLKAKTGGVFSGPEDGYWVQLHGKEHVTVEPDKVAKQELLDNASDVDNMLLMLEDRFDAMINHLETMTEYSRKSSNIQEEILTYTRE